MCSIHFHHAHSLLLGVRSPLSEPHNCIFWSFLASALAQRPRQPPSSPNCSAGTGPSVSLRSTRSCRYGKRAFLFCDNILPSCLSQYHSFVTIPHFRHNTTVSSQYHSFVMILDRGGASRHRLKLEIRALC